VSRVTETIRTAVQTAFPERVYVRIRRTADDQYIWEHFSESPVWLTDVGIYPNGNLLSRVRDDDTERTRVALHTVLTRSSAPLRMIVTFCSETNHCTALRMGMVQSSQDSNAIDGYLEPEEFNATLFGHPWLGPFLERIDISYTLINRAFEIIDFNIRSNEYAKAVLNKPLVIGESILSYASPESKTLLEHDLEQSFLGTEVRREWGEGEAESSDQLFSFTYVPFRDATGQIPLVAMCTVDLTRLRHVERRQRELAIAMAQSPISVIITDPQGAITYVNPFFEELTGYSAAEVLGENPRILKSRGLASDTDYGEMWATLTAGRIWTGEFRNRKKNGDEYLERAVLVPVTTDSGAVTSIVGLKENITELRRTMVQLAQREEHFRALFENAGGAIYIHDTGGFIRDANPMATVQTGYTKEELIGMHVGALDVGSGNRPPPEVATLLATGPHERAHHVNVDTTHRRKDGSEFPVEATLFIFSQQGEQLMAATVVDATERNARVEQIRRSAEDNAILLREVHHRVKNNLQTIASLLRLQLDSVRDEDAHILFQENIHRVLSMASVHEMLHETASLTEIDLNGYLRQLVHRSMDFAASQKKLVSIRVNGESVMAAIEQAVPFGLIASELMLDAIHHATRDGSPRDIEVTIGGDGGAHGALSVRDNGVATPAGTILRDAENDFGFTLIAALAQQINGTLQAIPDDTWHVRLTFVPQKHDLEGSAS
ncbi:MAG TPA: PAS domain S-box protein, partial [Alkalispirochaeta sp.]|nr:PAS domain S-box protein [Alkalispirochaeta sp.]